ncbi:uncharacterized protein [Aegilops tauschii subsp. strangulata]|uniref:uncharacterized protein n=1 Tax=Aegilops tauschii subsp. strangulata TaxID=200361 RepID=UPI00098AC36E|nr:uncharacterized protein LOC109772241 [Aegilops tauschii subsp. strangulata]
MHGTWWPDLPPELLREVSSRLHVGADFIRFHAVCKPWRDSHGPSTTTGTCQLLPWLLAPSKKSGDSLNFRCVFSNTSYVTPPAISDGSGTGMNWVASADGTAVRYFIAFDPHGLTLHDPLAGGPPTHLPDENVHRRLEENPTGIIHSDGAVLLFSKHDSFDTSTAEFRAALLRPGDTEWTFIHRTLESPSDGEFCVAYHNGKIHVTVEDSLWHVVSVTGESTAATNNDDLQVPRPRSMPRQCDGYLYERSYVLESRGELLWVSVHILMHYPDKGKNGVNDLVDALSMSMHTLEEVTKETEKLLWTRKDGRSLEDRVLFLGWPNSFALDASRLGMSGGFAYFLYYDDQGGCRLHERHGVFRHNLIDNTTEFVEWLPQGWDKEMCVWLLPQLTIAPVNQGPATTSRSNNTCAGVLMPNLLQEEDRDFTGHSYADIMLSVTSRPGTKADCSSEMISGKITFRRFASTFEAIL